MKRTLTIGCLATLIAVCSFVPAAQAQQQSDQTAKVKAEVVNRLNKKEEHVKIRLRNGTEVKGYITQTGDNGFTLSNEKTKTGTDIAYADVQHVEGRGMSKTKKIAIGVGIGAAVFAAMIAYAFTHFWD
jgi:sRNA-binding regulator protein Hfq